MKGEEQDEVVGTLAQEAARLASAFAAWTAQHGSDVGHHVHDAASTIKDQMAEGWHDLDAHLATGSAECRVCPVCRTVAAVRDVSPEVKAHLVSAASSLVAAASGLLATVVDEPPRHAAEPETGERRGPVPDQAVTEDEDAGRRRRGRSARQPVQRIDLDDE